MTRATIESEDLSDNELRTLEYISTQSLTFLAGEYVVNWLMISIQEGKTPFWKPKEMELNLLEGQHSLGFFPGFQEMPVLVLYLLWISKISLLQNQTCNQRSVCFRQCRNWAAYLKCPAVLIALTQTHFAKSLEKGINTLGRKGKTHFSTYTCPADSLLECQSAPALDSL